ncbi:MAG: hypothetical protein F6K30_26370 [Cyanothece sp. SIO2G6]|nr:hypothetical protein [Cyanothece sp. SIO2G6]
MTDAVSTNMSSSNTTTIAPKIGQWLEEYGEIATILPVLAGLLVTSRLRVRGAQALLVNLLIAALVRQVIVQLKQQAQPSALLAATPSINHYGENDGTSNGEASAEEDYMIVHSVPGRLRLRIPRLVSDASYAKRLEKLLMADERVKYVRLNRSASSLVIQYDGAGVSELELGMSLLQILEQAESDAPPTPVTTSDN